MACGVCTPRGRAGQPASSSGPQRHAPPPLLCLGVKSLLASGPPGGQPLLHSQRPRPEEAVAPPGLYVCVCGWRGRSTARADPSGCLHCPGQTLFSMSDSVGRCLPSRWEPRAPVPCVMGRGQPVLRLHMGLLRLLGIREPRRVLRPDITLMLPLGRVL